MRINNVEYPNVSIRVIESKRVVGLTGPKSIPFMKQISKEAQ